MPGGAAPGATHAKAGVRLPRRSRVPDRETIRGADHRLNSDQLSGHLDQGIANRRNGDLYQSTVWPIQLENEEDRTRNGDRT